MLHPSTSDDVDGVGVTRCTPAAASLYFANEWNECRSWSWWSAAHPVVLVVVFGGDLQTYKQELMPRVYEAVEEAEEREALTGKRESRFL